MGYFAAEDLMLMAEEAVEIRVLRRQGRAFARSLGCSTCHATLCDAICGSKGRLGFRHSVALGTGLSPLMLTMIEWCRMRSSVAAVSTLSPAKALFQEALNLVLGLRPPNARNF